MPLLHCKKCHHEWEGWKWTDCDWCGGSGEVIAEETQFERFCKEFIGRRELLRKFLNEH